MKGHILLFILSIITTVNVLCQSTIKIIGEWRIYEMTTDRLYKNFETDSIYLFSEADQENFKNPEVRKGLSQTFNMLSNNFITIDSDSSLIFNFPGMPAGKEKFTYDPEKSTLSLGSPGNLVKLKFIQNEILVMDLSDEYETNKITFKRKKD